MIPTPAGTIYRFRYTAGGMYVVERSCRMLRGWFAVASSPTKKEAVAVLRGLVSDCICPGSADLTESEMGSASMTRNPDCPRHGDDLCDVFKDDVHVVTETRSQAIVDARVLRRTLRRDGEPVAGRVRVCDAYGVQIA